MAKSKICKKALRGAEAIITPVPGKKGVLTKIRLEKKYRIKEIDKLIRERRTRSEAKLLLKSAQEGIPAPRLLKTGKFDIEISEIEGVMLNRFLEGRMAGTGETSMKSPAKTGLKTRAKTSGESQGEADLGSIFIGAGDICAKIHKAGMCHGDYTPANLILGKAGSLSVIDFGLGKFTDKREDFATDYLTFLKSTKEFSAYHADFEKGYLAIAGEASPIPALAQKIDKRSMYMQRD